MFNEDQFPLCQTAFQIPGAVHVGRGFTPRPMCSQKRITISSGWRCCKLAMWPPQLYTHHINKCIIFLNEAICTASRFEKISIIFSHTNQTRPARRFIVCRYDDVFVLGVSTNFKVGVLCSQHSNKARCSMRCLVYSLYTNNAIAPTTQLLSTNLQCHACGCRRIDQCLLVWIW
jgi:hypothetical protein